VLDKKDPNGWWNTFEVNIRGVFNFVRYSNNAFRLLKSSSKIASSAAIPDLEKTQGYIIAISSIGAQLRFPGGSDGCITKHAVNRLVEFIALGKILISLLFLFSIPKKPMITLKIANSLTQSTRAFVYLR
jgi:NAD(P)-dependent dehydrogenase (short-subunit alcohol dehydrogenase family)